LGIGHHHFEQPTGAVNFYFSPGTANKLLFSILSDQFLFFQTVFFFLQLEQPMPVTDSYFLRMFCPFGGKQ